MARWLTLVVALLCALPAHADRRERSRQERYEPPPVQQPAPSFERQGRRDAEERQQRGGGRMSPEERRQLRRDIHDAGREVYRDRR